MNWLPPFFCFDFECVRSRVIWELVSSVQFATICFYEPFLRAGRLCSSISHPMLLVQIILTAGITSGKTACVTLSSFLCVHCSTRQKNGDAGSCPARVSSALMLLLQDLHRPKSHWQAAKENALTHAYSDLAPDPHFARHDC